MEEDVKILYNMIVVDSHSSLDIDENCLLFPIAKKRL
jgi:hypothetical protein